MNKNNSGGRFFYFVFFVIIWSSVKKDQMCRTTLKRWTWSGRKIPRDLFYFFHVWWSETHFSLWHKRKENSMCRNISLETFSSFVKQSRQFFFNIYSNYIFTVCNKVNMQFKCLIVSLVVQSGKITNKLVICFQVMNTGEKTIQITRRKKINLFTSLVYVQIWHLCF